MHTRLVQHTRCILHFTMGCLRCLLIVLVRLSSMVEETPPDPGDLRVLSLGAFGAFVASTHAATPRFGIAYVLIRVAILLMVLVGVPQFVGTTSFAYQASLLGQGTT